MPYYVICGKVDCPGFAHAIYVAQYLSKNLPRFEFLKVEKSLKEWALYVRSLNESNSWFISESPLIWKEIAMWGGKKYLLGGLSEFWEYVYCYYGLESLLPRNEVLKIAQDNLKFYQEKQYAENKSKNEYEENQTGISILGVCKQTPLLLYELLELKCLRKNQNILIKLFDTLGGRDPFRSAIIELCRNYIDFSQTESLIIVENIESALENCDILIYMYDLSQKEGENEYEWFSRAFFRMQILAENINEYARRNLKVILNYHGPTCFMASILLEYCTRLRPYNIVVVTADEGLSMLSIISKKIGLKVAQLGAPPVWGFIGVNSYVDERNIVCKATMYRPYERSLSAPRGSTLPLGTKKSELRLLSYLVKDLDHDEIMRAVEERRHTVRDLFQPTGLSKIRALVSLLREWYSDSCSGNIISLGVYSNGSFGLPTGIVFSQPVKLDESGKWVPYSKFPLMDDTTSEKIITSAKEAKEICDKYIIPNINCQDQYKDSDWNDVDGEYVPTEEISFE